MVFMGVDTHLHAGIGKNTPNNTIVPGNWDSSGTMVRPALYRSNSDSNFQMSPMRKQFSYAELNSFLLSEMPPLWAASL